METTEMDQIRSRLEDHGYRLTPQRMRIVEAVLAEEDKHLSADDIYTILWENHPEIGIATVYRTLEILRELGIVNQLTFEEGVSRYEYSAREHHHHLVCLKCGKVIEFSNDELERLEQKLARKYDFQIVGHHLKLYGYCSLCQ